ncbi:MAG: LPS export ABC transporter permease LptF [Acidobacteriota bacterium]
MIRRLDRYIFSELLGPLALGFSVYTFILLMQFLFKSAELIIRRGLAVGTVARLFWYTLPNILVLTLPMSLLFAILVAIGRMSSDSELIAVRACGVSLYRLYRPILALSTALGLVTLWVTLALLPQGNHNLQKLRIQAATAGATGQVEPRIFNTEFPGRVVYVFQSEKRGWKGVFLAPSLPPAQHEVTVADRGELRVDDAGERVVLHLENAVTHKVNLDEPDKYELSQSQTLDQQLLAPESRSGPIATTTSKGIRERSLSELRAMAAEPGQAPELRRSAQIEIHKKFAIPMACVVFGLLALPLGFNNRRGGKSSGFALSLGVLLGYYILLSNGEEAAHAGKITPVLAMWLPNALFAAFAVVLAYRRNRDLEFRLPRWGRPWLVRKRTRASAGPGPRTASVAGAVKPDLILRFPRLRLVFPNLLDRYVMTAFGRSLLIVSLSAMIIYVVADLSEIIDDVLKNKIGAGLLVTYYKYFSLQIFYDLAPIIVLVATLIALSLLARTNEVTACKALGVSLYRLCVPVLAGAMAVAGLCAFLQAEVLPASNQKVFELRDRIKGRDPNTQVRRRIDEQWLFGQGRYVYNYLYFDAKQSVLQHLQVFEFDEKNRLVRRLFAKTAQYLDGRWVFTDGWTRTFDGARVTSYSRFQQPVHVDYPETPAYFRNDVKRPSEMRYGELSEYVSNLKSSGQLVPDLEVDLASKIAFPVVSFVMACVGLPFAFRLGRRGALYGIGLAVVLGIVFVGVFAFFRTLGQTGALPPLVSVWSPSVIFGLLAAYLFLGVET